MNRCRWCLPPQPAGRVIAMKDPYPEEVHGTAQAVCVRNSATARRGSPIKVRDAPGDLVGAIR